jgi:ribonucleoside-diphosphate reductase alpha chain
MKDWSEIVRQGKKEDFNFPGRMDGTNISVILDTEFFEAYNDPLHIKHDTAANVYWSCIRGLLSTGEPGFSVDIGDNEGENCRNACCEITSRDDSDMCNLGSINLAKIASKEELHEVVKLGTAFLLCGTLYSKLPIENMYRIREKNRRLGLGLMGMHEWLLKRGKRYEKDSELEEWLRVYECSGAFANYYADKLGISRPIATRAVAPTGTISIVAETTSGIEPIFATAQKRRYLDGNTWKASYIVDPTAKRLIEEGADPSLIEDALSLAEDVERRMIFQAWVQGFVDHGISSTINLPPWGSSLNNESTVTQFGNRLLKYLPHLRGITAYPDGSRDGQPLVRVPYEEAIAHTDVEFVDGSEANCKGGVCGS